MEVGSPWIECSSSYTGSTADALGCPADALSNNTWLKDSPKGLPVQDESLTLTAEPAIEGSDTVLVDVEVANANAFWTLANGENLNYGQVMVSAMLHRSQHDLAVELAIDITPYDLNSEAAVTAVMFPVPANDPGL